MARAVEVVVPEIAACEVRRELTRSNAPGSLRRLDDLVRAYIVEQNRSVPLIESIRRTRMTGTSKHCPRRSHGAGRRSDGAEPHFEPSMQTI